jgi:glycosyltransferase involved in cell wall biosynthesis
MPIISVIIPTYNRQRFVVKAIDSVLRQSFGDYEIIVVDDGSTDNTRAALDAYAGKLRAIYQENSGVSSARNAGIKEARGQWIAFLDSDDEWARDYLSAQMEQVKKFPNAVAHIANAVSVFADGTRNDHFAEIDLLREFGDEPCMLFIDPFCTIVGHGFWFLQSTILRKDILFQTGLFDEELSIAEDLDILARVAKKGAFSISRRELVEIIRRDEEIENLGTQSLKKPAERCASYDKVYLGLLNTLNLTRSEKTAISRPRGAKWRALGNIMAKEGRKLEARRCYRKALSSHPTVRSLAKLIISFLPVVVSHKLVKKR